MKFQSKEAYCQKFEVQINQKKTKQSVPRLYAYMQEQFDQLDNLLKDLSEETFWQTIPLILGVDAKLSLLVESVQLEEFTADELIRMIEQDYRTYHKELCGYNLSMETNPSLIFHVQ